MQTNKKADFKETNETFNRRLGELNESLSQGVTMTEFIEKNPDFMPSVCGQVAEIGNQVSEFSAEISQLMTKKDFDEYSSKMREQGALRDRVFKDVLDEMKTQQGYLTHRVELCESSHHHFRIATEAQTEMCKQTRDAVMMLKDHFDSRLGSKSSSSEKSDIWSKIPIKFVAIFGAAFAAVVIAVVTGDTTVLEIFKR